MQEIWKAIDKYEGIYEISSLGRVRSAKGKITYSELGEVRHWKQRIFKQKIDRQGYKRVTLYKNKVGKSFLVHRLVAISFLKPDSDRNIVNHKDGNPQNNHVENLEWATYSENLIHAFDNRLNNIASPIVLFNVISKELKYFRSESDASKFLGRNQGFVSDAIKKKKTVVDDFEIFHK